MSVAAGIMAAGSLASAGVNAFASNSASNAQQAAGQKALNLVNQNQGTVNPALAPYTGLGNTASSSLVNLLANPSSITSTPGYQFNFNQGEQALQNSAAAQGTLKSSGTLKALDRYGQNYAQNAYQQQIGNLLGISQLGLGATNTGINANLGYTGLGTSALTGIGNAQAQGILGMGNAISGGIGGATNALGLMQLLGGMNGGNSTGPYSYPAGPYLNDFGGGGG